MSLINCPDCNTQVSDFATECPNCGHPIKSVQKSSISERVKKAPSIPTTKEVVQPTEKSNSSKSGLIYLVIFVLLILFATLPFHYYLTNFKVFPKDHLTFSNTFITEEDVNDCIKKFEDASLFEKVSLLNDSFIKKLIENNILVRNSDSDISSERDSNNYTAEPAEDVNSNSEEQNDKVYPIIEDWQLAPSTSKLEDLNEESIFESESSFENSVIRKFEVLSAQIAEIYKNDTTRVELYIPINQSGGVKRVPNYDNYPDAINESYSLIRDLNGKIICFELFNSSESGDWATYKKSLFDEDGNLVSFARDGRSFVTGCSGFREVSVYYFDKSHNLIKKTYELTDKDDNKVSPHGCDFSRDKNIFFTTVTQLLKKYHF
jgi:hypothetical protein